MNTMKGNDAFERSLRESLDPYEVPYNSADWALLEKRLDEGTTNGRWKASSGLYALLLGGTLAVATTVHLMVSEEYAGTGASGIVELVVFNQEPTMIDRPEGIASSAPVTEVGNDRSLDKALPKKSTHTNAAVRRSDATPRDPRSKSSDQGSSGATANKAATEEAGIRATVTEGCPGTMVEFSMVNMPEDGIYLWNFGDGNFSNKPKPSHTFSKPGTFEVMLSHSSMSGGKLANKPVSDLIVIHEVPEASFHFARRDYDNAIPSVHFENRSNGGKSYHWDFGDGGTSVVAHPDHVFKKQGAYTVTLTVTNTAGCVDRTERTIRIDSDYNLLAAKAFSPNGDGLDDTFIPDALRTLGVKFHMSVFDARTGALLYETTDPQRPWNGRINNKGESCSPGDYLWMVEMKDGEGLGGTYNGTVSLLR